MREGGRCDTILLSQSTQQKLVLHASRQSAAVKQLSPWTMVVNSRPGSC